MHEPKDVEGECNAHLYIADNFSDNHATMRCELKPEHEGMHHEIYRGGTVIVLWEHDDRDFSKISDGEPHVGLDLPKDFTFKSWEQSEQPIKRTEEQSAAVAAETKRWMTVLAPLREEIEEGAKVDTRWEAVADAIRATPEPLVFREATPDDPTERLRLLATPEDGS